MAIQKLLLKAGSKQIPILLGLLSFIRISFFKFGFHKV